MKTKKQIVLETIQFYGSDPANRRSVNKINGTQTCLYNGPGGKHCAFARYVKPELQPQLPEGESALIVLARMPSCLLPEVSHLSSDKAFWQSLQSFHDVNQHWDPVQGLSELGKAIVLIYLNLTQEDLDNITFDTLPQ